MKPFVSVVIPTCDREELLKKCLFSLFQQTYPKERYEIIVADDSTTDKTKRFVDSLSVSSPRVTYVKSGGKSGTTHTMNVGVREARGEIIFFISDDCTADREWINEIIKIYEKHPEIDGAGGRIYSDPTQPKNFIIKYMEALKIIPFTQLIISDKMPFLGGITAYRKKIISDLGGFDENIKFVGDDYNFYKSFRERGYKFAYVPTAIVYHHQRENVIPYLKHDCFGRGRGYFAYISYKKGKILSFTLIISEILLIILTFFNLGYLSILLLSYFIGAILFAQYRGFIRNLRRTGMPYSLIFMLFFVLVEFPLKITGYSYEGLCTISNKVREKQD